MSLVSDELSIISIGCSCQVSEQLKKNKETLSALTGVNFRNDSSYFDYIITPVDSFCRMAYSDFPKLTDPKSIIVKDKSPFWTDEELWFVHNFRHGGSLGPIDIESCFGTGASKIEYLRTKFSELAHKSEQFVFVIANSQDLTAYAETSAAFEAKFGFERDRMQHCVNVLKAKFGEKFSGLLAVEAEGSESEPYEIDGLTRTTVTKIPAWWGHDGSWSEMLSRELPKILHKSGCLALSPSL